MRRLLPCVLVLFAGFAQAQSVDWNRAWSGCTTQASEFDRAAEGAHAPSLGRSPNWRDNRDYFAQQLGPSATRENLQRAMAQYRANYDAQDPYDRAGARLAICGLTAAIKQLGGGSRPVAPSAATPTTATRQESESERCVVPRPSSKSLVNQCGRPVSLGWCAVPHDPTTFSNHHCERQQFEQIVLSPSAEVVVDDGAQIAWIHCESPKRVKDLRYASGTGLTGRCVR